VRALHGDAVRPWGDLDACLRRARALARRRDRDEVVDDVSAQSTSRALASIFALEYFVCITEPKPPVGAVVAGAKDW